MQVPEALRIWFIVHGVVDLVAALPLLVAPEVVLRALGWTCVDPAATRLVASALLAIGGQSLLMRNASADVYRAMVSLKVIWSFAAAASLFVAIGAGAPAAAWGFLSIFIAFAGVWLHHAIRFRQLARLHASETPDEEPQTNADTSADGDADTNDV
jgi:hypothetical protein